MAQDLSAENNRPAVKMPLAEEKIQKSQYFLKNLS